IEEHATRADVLGFGVEFMCGFALDADCRRQTHIKTAYSSPVRRLCRHGAFVLANMNSPPGFRADIEGRVLGEACSKTARVLCHQEFTGELTLSKNKTRRGN